MSSKPVKLSAGRALSPGAIALMLMLCLSWGFNQIAVKLVLADVPPMLQALIRSVGALPVLLAIGWFRGVKFFARGGVSVCGAVLRRARLVCLSRRTVAGAAMGWPGPEFRRRRAGDRGPPDQCRCDGFAGRPADRRRRRALGDYDADRQDDGADQGSGGKGARLSG